MVAEHSWPRRMHAASFDPCRSPRCSVAPRPNSGATPRSIRSSILPAGVPVSRFIAICDEFAKARGAIFKDEARRDLLIRPAMVGETRVAPMDGVDSSRSLIYGPKAPLPHAGTALSYSVCEVQSMGRFAHAIRNGTGFLHFSTCGNRRSLRLVRREHSVHPREHALR
jgi:hypothetical protein